MRRVSRYLGMSLAYTGALKMIIYLNTLGFELYNTYEKTVDLPWIYRL